MEIKMTHYCEYNRNKLSQNKFEINPKQANAETLILLIPKCFQYSSYEQSAPKNSVI